MSFFITWRDETGKKMDDARGSSMPELMDIFSELVGTGEWRPEPGHTFTISTTRALVYLITHYRREKDDSALSKPPRKDGAHD